jgi:hypothetical protein
MGHGGEHGEKRRFAATFFRRFNGDVGDDVAQFKGSGMQHPNGQGGSGVVAQDNVLFDNGFNVVEEVGDVDGFWMRGDGVEDNGLSFHNGFLGPLWRGGLDIGGLSLKVEERIKVIPGV